MFWDVCMKGFEEFYKKIKGLPAKSLSLTNKVLKARENIEVSIVTLR